MSLPHASQPADRRADDDRRDDADGQPRPEPSVEVLDRTTVDARGDPATDHTGDVDQRPPENDPAQTLTAHEHEEHERAEHHPHSGDTQEN